MDIQRRLKQKNRKLRCPVCGAYAKVLYYADGEAIVVCNNHRGKDWMPCDLKNPDAFEKLSKKASASSWDRIICAIKK